MTDHAEVVPNPYTRKGRLPRHIQSHWIAVRKPMFSSDQWRSYWDDMPPITSYTDSILRHESRFTEHFQAAGRTAEVAFPQVNYASQHPAFDNADRLLLDGCPVLKRRPFFHYPLYLDKEAILGRRLLEIAEAKGYPVRMVLQNMARNAEPRILNTNASLFRVLSDETAHYDASKPPRVAAIVHIFYEDMTEELLDRLDLLPVDYDLYVTTTDRKKANAIKKVIAAHPGARVTKSEVRVLPSNRGRDLSAYFIACRDIAGSSDYDLIVKIHSKKTVQSSANIGGYFKDQQIDNLLSSKPYAANILGLFQREPGLGMVFPPTVHFGHPTLGGAWFENKKGATVLAKQLGIRVPLDDVSPLAPMGAMWICRPEALRLMTDTVWSYEDYAHETDHRDGSLAHVQERIVTYAAGELGYHVRTVANVDHAEISHAFLEYKYDQLGATLPGTAMEKVQVMRGRGLTKTAITFAKSYLVHKWPRFSRAIMVFPYRPARALYRWARRRPAA
jgi:rhamnosyltransferase